MKDLTLLYCVSKYPSQNKDFNINNIKILKEKFRCKVGLSDHSKDHNIVRAAIAAGAEVIEKHIALENQTKGLDIEFSIKGKEIGEFRHIMNETYNLLGKNYFYRDKSEEKSKVFRRSLFAVQDIKKGSKFTKENIRRIRPNHGLEPKYYDKILNKFSPISISKGEPLPKNLVNKLKI